MDEILFGGKKVQIRKYLEQKEMKCCISYLQDEGKAAPRGKFMALNT